MVTGVYSVPMARAPLTPTSSPATLALLAVLAAAPAACGGAPGHRRAVAASASAGEAPFEFALGAAGACVRDGGRVYCGPFDDPGRPLVRGPPLDGVDDAEGLSLNRAGDLGCILRKGGELACFGSNSFGQLGAGLRVEGRARPVPVRGVRGATRVVAGDDDACAILDDGGVRCWGANDSGQVGGAVDYGPRARGMVAPVAVDEAQGAFDVALGWKTTCALVGAGDVLCWGAPFVPPWRGGTDSGAHPPWRLSGPTAFRDIDAHYRSFCGVSRGEVFCWGELDYLAAGKTHYTDAPRRVGLAGVTRVRVGPQRACALYDDGRVSCWGFETNGLLGRGSDPDCFGTLGPAPVAGLPPAVDVAFNDSATCAVTAQREVYCWGVWFTPGGGQRVETRPVKMRVLE